MLSRVFPRLSRRNDRDRLRAAYRRRRLITLEAMEERQLLSGIWTGAVDGNWSNPANWDNNAVPTALVPVVIDSANLTGNSVSAITLSGNAVARSLTINSGVSLDLNGNTLSVNTAMNRVQPGYTQNGGSVTGAGTSALIVSANFTVDPSATFSVDNVTFKDGWTGTVTSDLTFNNVTIDYGGDHFIAAAGHPLNVNGKLTIDSFGTISGDIYAYGAVDANDATYSINYSPGTLHLVGNANKTLTGIGAGVLPRVSNELSAGKTLTLTGTITPENWTQVSGNLSAAGSTTTFRRGAYYGTIVDTGTTQLGNVVIDTGSNWITINNLKVGGNLTITSTSAFNKGGGAPASGVVTVTGNLTSNDTSVGGPADIVMLGGTSATITANPGDFPNGGITIDKGASPEVTANVTQPLDSVLTLTSNAIGGLKGYFAIGHNVVTNDTALNGNTDGSPVLVFKGTAAQTLTANAANGMVPGLRFDKSGGSFTLVNNANVSGANALNVNGSWIVDATNTAPVNVGGTNVKIGNNNGQPRTIDTGNSAGFNNLELTPGSSTVVTIPAGGSSKAIVNGLLTITQVSKIVGTIEARGDVYTSDTGVGNGPGTILFNGTGNQLLSAAPTGGQVPSVVINKTAGTLSLGTDPIGVSGDWTYTKGGINTAGSTLVFQGGSTFIDAGTSPAMSFHNVTIDKGSSPTLTITNKLPVNNDLTINSIGTINADPGKITVGGNLTSNDTSVAGTADITMIGANAASIIGGDFPNGGIVIKQDGKVVTANVTHPLDGPLTLYRLGALKGTFQVGRDVTTMDASVAGNDDGSPVLVFKGNQAQKLSLGISEPEGMVPGLKVDKSGGSLTVNSASNPNGSGPYTLQVSGSWIVASNTPVHMNSTPVRFRVSNSFSGSLTIATGTSAGFADVEFYVYSAPVTVTKMIVNGDLQLTTVGNINGADIDVYGSVYTKVNGGLENSSSRIRLLGSNNQTIAAFADNRQIPGVIIAKSGGTLTLDPSKVIAVTGNWDYTSGTVVTTNSTIKFIGGTKIIRPGSMIFHNVNFAVGSADHVEIRDTSNDPATLKYKGTASNQAKVTVGSLLYVGP